MCLAKGFRKLAACTGCHMQQHRCMSKSCHGKQSKEKGTGGIPDVQGEAMTRVRFAIAFNGGRPLSQTRNGICSTVPTGKLELMPQFCSPTLANSCPARVGPTTPVSSALCLTSMT